jgi:thiol:disulfide interchange protein
MDRLKRFLAIPMGASVVAAIWLLSRQAGIAGLALGLLSAALLFLLLWRAGQQQKKGNGASGAFVIAAAGTIILMLLVPRVTYAGARAPANANAWTEERLSAALQQKKPVFVYFTADWCITCKVNEAAAIDRKDVQNAFKRAGVVVLVGDWTNGAPAITRFLENRGRAGVPYYLWYAPGAPPEELPQILTPAMLIGRAQQRKP